MNSLVVKTAEVARTMLGVPARPLARSKGSRRLLNNAYNAVSPKYYSVIHFMFAKMFADEANGHAEPGQWMVRFAEQPIAVPITSERLWLDWDTALSILGHDAKIKQTYINILGSEARPDQFIDIGANYGTHSLLFLKHGIETVSFEPNSVCHSYFREVCTLNRVTPAIEHVALGNHEGTAELRFPERETWLGSILNAPTDDRTQSQTVALKTLDSYLPWFDGKRKILIKIDTEGCELRVLRGAKALLKRHHPIILFESLPDPESRGELFKELAPEGYAIAHLPWQPGIKTRILNKEEFSSDFKSNFVAFSPVSRPATD